MMTISYRFHPRRRRGMPARRGAATIRTTLLAGLALAASSLPFADRARASFIQDLAVSSLFGPFTGSGQIEFATASGNSAAGVIAFSFAGTGPLAGFSFTAADIQSILWSIDPVSSALTLNLATMLDQPPTTTQVATCVLLQNNAAGGSCGGIFSTSSSFSRVAQQKIGQTSTGGGNLAASPVQNELPEPASLTLLAAALAIAAAIRRTAAPPAKAGQAAG